MDVTAAARVPTEVTVTGRGSVGQRRDVIICPGGAADLLWPAQWFRSAALKR
ncbi:MAG TPA: hypothetical protein VN875_10530 [Candidatus Binatus sp.]|nr:hypothetical protein [Candidatus Binatus sp.]